MRGADLVVRTLEAHGVRTVFTLSGNQIMPVFDACVGTGLRLVHTRHEAAAVFMAEAWAQVTGEIGVALVTAGPGFANALSPLYGARASETPLLLLSGDAPAGQKGLGAFQEMPQSAMATPFVKSSVTVEDPAELGRAVSGAIATAQAGRPGPVHLALPFDVLAATADAAVPAPAPAETAPVAPDAAQEIAGALAGAARPLVLAGPHLCRHWHRRSLAALGDALAAPVVRMESPRGLNDPSLGDFAGLLARADLVFLLGKPLDFAVGFCRPPALAAGCRVVQLDPDEAVLERSRRALGERLLAAHRADAAASLPALGEAAAAAAVPHRPDWLAEAEAALSFRPADWDVLAGDTAGGLHPVAVCRAVGQILDAAPDAILVSDGGEVGQWAQACLSARRRVINGPGGAIGAAIPYAIAARLADPGATVLALTGDGAAGFHIAEFETAARERAPFVAVVGNDARWNAEHQIQLRDYGENRLLGCELSDAGYDAAAAAFGGAGERVSTAGELSAALDRAVASGLPACINVRLAGQPAPKLRRG